MALLRVPLVRVALIWLVLAAFLLVRAWPSVAERQFPDPDDILRLVQVRDLLSGQGWFDLHQYRIGGPDGTLMHWSRLVDVPLLLVIGSLSPLVGPAGAELAAEIVIPLLTLAAILVLVARIAARFSNLEGVTLACVSVGLSSLLLAQTQPFRIDHHGWQVVAMLAAVAGLLPGRQAWRPALAGGALAAGLSISLELLPIAAAVGAAFALRWLVDGTTSRPLVTFLASLAAALCALFAATRGLADLVQHCDTISPVHLGAIGLLAAGSAVVAWRRPATRISLVAALALPVLAAGALFAWSAPHCLAGPFGNLDPLVRAFWYENVSEGQPVWRISYRLWFPAVAHGVMSLITLGWLWRIKQGEERQWWFEYLLVSGVAFVTGLLVWRSMAFVGALAAIPLGWLAGRLLEQLREAQRPLGKAAVALGILVVIVPAAPIMLAGLAGLASARAAEATEPSSSSACQIASAAPALDKLRPATVFAPLDLGPALLAQTRHKVVATAHHRANHSMRQVLAAFLGSPAEAHSLIAREGADYVMLCIGMGEVSLYRKRAPDGFAARLADGQIPAWLEPVPLPGSDGLRLWRVRAAPDLGESRTE